MPNRGCALTHLVTEHQDVFNCHLFCRPEHSLRQEGASAFPVTRNDDLIAQAFEKHHGFYPDIAFIIVGELISEEAYGSFEVIIGSL